MNLRALYWVLVGGFVWAVVAHSQEIEQVVDTLLAGRLPWIGAAVVLQVAYYLAFTGVYQTAFRAVGVRSRVRDLIPVMFASLFVNVAAPSAGTGGAAVFVDDAVRRGESGARAAAGTLLALVADLIAFLLVLGPGLWYLRVQHDLRPYDVAGALVLIAIIGALAAVLLLGLWRPAILQALLRGVERAAGSVARWIRRPSPLPAWWPERTAAEFAEAGAAVAGRPQRLFVTLASALAAHLLDVLTLYAIVSAYHGPVSPGVVVAAYGVAVLFWIVAITPQGIGIVEGAVTVTLVSLGIPAARAAAIALAFRGLSFWLPMAVGFVLLRRLRSFTSAQRRPTEAWPVRAIALLSAAVGVLDVALGLRPHLGERMRGVVDILPFVPRHGAHFASVLAGFGLLGLAGNLWRRKRAGWVLTLGLLAVSAVALWLRGFHRPTTLVVMIAAWMVVLRAQFHARSDPPSVRQGLRALAGAALFTLGYGVAGFYVLDRHFSVNFSLGAALRQTVVMFTEFWDPGLEPVTGFGRYFADSIYLLATVSFAYAAMMLTRPVLLRSPATPVERTRAAGIVASHGHSSLARLTLLDDKAYFFTSSGSVVAYAVSGRTAVALGDPIGPQEDALTAVREFAVFCRRNDWLPAFYQTLPEYLDHYRAAGFQMLCIGHEAIVDLASFTLSGGSMRDVRGAVNRLTRLGVREVLHAPPIADEIIAELRAVSDEWLAAVKGTEKRFSLGWFDDAYIRGGPVMAVHGPDGAITAFANIIPEYQAAEATIDLMRRRGTAHPGTMDFLFVSLFAWAKGQGYATFNLGLSPLAGVGEAAADPAAERALHYIYDHVNQFYNFKGLHQFKEKFAPRWSPRYLMHPGLASLPAVALAIIALDAGRPQLRDYVRLVARRARRVRPQPEAAGGA